MYNPFVCESCETRETNSRNLGGRYSESPSEGAIIAKIQRLSLIEDKTNDEKNELKQTYMDQLRMTERSTPIALKLLYQHVIAELLKVFFGNEESIVEIIVDYVKKVPILTYPERMDSLNQAIVFLEKSTVNSFFKDAWYPDIVLRVLKILLSQDKYYEAIPYFNKIKPYADGMNPTARNSFFSCLKTEPRVV